MFAMQVHIGHAGFGLGLRHHDFILGSCDYVLDVT